METETNIIKTSPISLSSKGYYSLNVYKEDGSEVVEKRIENSGNVVTYEGAYRLFFEGNMFSSLYANVGTGTSELTRNSVGLGNRFNATSSGAGADRPGNEVDNGDGTSTLTLTRTMSFSLGATTGTFSEVGISVSSNGSNFIAGQLIKDEFGNPTTITVLSDEQLRVTYTLELTVPNGELGVQPVIGSGTVTTPEGTSNYTIYSQPFFAAYGLGSSQTTNRLTTSSNVNVWGDSSGASVSFISSGGITKIHDGSGTVTVTNGNTPASPTAFSSSDIKYQGVGGAVNNSASLSALNTATKRYPNHPSAYQYAAVEFTPALVKDSTRSLASQVEVVYSI